MVQRREFIFTVKKFFSNNTYNTGEVKCLLTSPQSHLSPSQESFINAFMYHWPFNLIT